MLPLIKMAWVLNRRLLVQVSPLFLFYLAQLVGVQHGGSTALFATFALFITALVTTLVTLQGLTLPVEGFLLALPISRAQVVRAKYLTSLLGWALGLALPLATAWAAHLVAPAWVPPASPTALGIVSLGGTLFALGILLGLPLVYRFGPSKGLMIFSALAILVPAGALAWKGANGCMDVLEAFGTRWLEQPLFALSVVATTLLLGLGSLRFSEGAYRRRAF